MLLELVERLGNLMRSELRKSGSEESLQPVHLQALIYLSKANRYSNTPQALADYLGLTKGTVSQTLLLLDRRGLIERFEDDIDRRVVRWVVEALCRRDAPSQRDDDPPALEAVANPAS